MGLLDKVKQVAGEVGEAAKKGASQVQSKVEQGQTRKKADEAAKQLGYLIYRERQEGAQAGGEVDRLVAEIKTLEDQLAEMQRQEAEQAAGSGSAAGPDVPPPAPTEQAPEEATGE